MIYRGNFWSPIEHESLYMLTTESVEKNTSAVPSHFVTFDTLNYVHNVFESDGSFKEVMKYVIFDVRWTVCYH